MQKRGSTGECKNVLTVLKNYPSNIMITVQFRLSELV